MDGIAKDFLGIKGHVDEQRVVNAFVARNSEDALKKAPKVRVYCYSNSQSLSFSAVLSVNGALSISSLTKLQTGRNLILTLLDLWQGFPKDHPEIALLRLRSFTVGRHLTDDEVSNSGFLQQTVGLLLKIEPLVCIPLGSSRTPSVANWNMCYRRSPTSTVL